MLNYALSVNLKTAAVDFGILRSLIHLGTCFRLYSLLSAGSV